jgi:AraC-like DNA-binding protein
MLPPTTTARPAPATPPAARAPIGASPGPRPRPARPAIAPSTPPLPRAVATLLTPTERAAVDAVGTGVYRAVHRASLDEVRRDLSARAADAVVVSAACCTPRDALRMAALLREHPRVPLLAVVSQGDGVHPQSLLALGRSGVRTVIDTRQAGGWRILREAMAGADTGFTPQVACAELRRRLPAAGDDCLALLDLLFVAQPCLHTVRALAAHVGVHPGTLQSRFVRHGLPPTKRYLALGGLVRAAIILDDARTSISTASHRLDYSSPQAFGRHVRLQLGLPAGEWRTRFDGEGMFARFCAELVDPYVERLSSFMPFSS